MNESGNVRETERTDNKETAKEGYAKYNMQRSDVM